ncbi:MAG: GPW/gp25 family protein [Candidatus Aenigmatarchaeota archaeon]
MAQIKLGAIGQIVTGLEDLNQEIKLILETPLGSVPHRPEYGSRIYEYLDLPINIAKPLIIAETYRAIKANCDRFEVIDVKVKEISPDGKLDISVIGRPFSSEIDEVVKLEILANFTKQS